MPEFSASTISEQETFDVTAHGFNELCKEDDKEETNDFCSLSRS